MDLDALYKLTHGLYVLGARDGDRMVGSLVDAVMQVANKPLVIALSCTNTSYTKKCIDETKEFSLSVICKAIDPFVVANFGYQTSKHINKWDNVDCFVKDNLPYLKDNLANFKCKVLSSEVFESNVLYLAEVVEALDSRDAQPLTYLDYRSYFKDDVIKSFENYKKEKKGNVMSDTEEKKWVCTVCGYVYDGDVKFEDLPEDWLCPLCAVDKSFFELQ